MSIFSDRSFCDLMDKLLVIHPTREDCMTGVGYDLNIGFYIQINRRLKTVIASGEVKDGDKRTIELKPDHYMVIVTREFVYLSCRVAATFHAKSTLASQAIFINSTTGDPNWDGRLIFLLSNAAGSSVGIRLDKSFTTMVVNYVERRSDKIPKESKTVLHKYIEGFNSGFSQATHYVLKKDQEYIKRAYKAKIIAGHSTPVFLFLILFHRYVLPKRHGIVNALILIILCFFLYIIFKPPVWLQQIGVDEKLISIIGSLCSIFSVLYLIGNMYRQRNRKSKTPKQR